MGNALQFKVDLEQEFEKEVVQGHTNLMKRAAVLIHNTAVRNSRERTGFMKSAWGVTVGVAPVFNNRGTADLLRMRPFDDVFVHNQAEYSSFHETGTVRILPQPMVGPGIQAARSLRA